MKWIVFFASVDGRIGRKTFWQALIAVSVIQVVIGAIAAATAEPMANEAVGDMAMGIVLFIFFYPQFVISAKRGHDRNISTWGRASLRRLVADQSQSERILLGKSDFIRVHHHHRNRQPGAAHRTRLSPRHAGPESLRA
jgi:Protein of unknown function (DUF805)